MRGRRSVTLDDRYMVVGCLPNANVGRWEGHPSRELTPDRVYPIPSWVIFAIPFPCLGSNTEFEFPS
jgi:hypothetical protein